MLLLSLLHTKCTKFLNIKFRYKMMENKQIPEECCKIERKYENWSSLLMEASFRENQPRVLGHI